jgi:hypothetical protein
MAVNTSYVEGLTPEEIFSVLADPFSYADWVFGASEIRGVEGVWPTVGSTFHHTQGLPWFGPKDSSSVLEVTAPRRLKLRVRLRPLMIAEVAFTLTSQGSGTAIEMVERPVQGLLARLHNPLFDALIRMRNSESLRRLAELARRRRSESGLHRRAPEPGRA